MPEFQRWTRQSSSGDLIRCGTQIPNDVVGAVRYEIRRHASGCYVVDRSVLSKVRRLHGFNETAPLPPTREFSRLRDARIWAETVR